MTETESERATLRKALDREWAKGFGGRIRKLSRETDRSLNKFDESLGRSEGYTSSTANKNQMPGARVIVGAADFFGATYEYLLEGSDPMLRPSGPTPLIRESKNFKATLAEAKKRWPHIPEEAWASVGNVRLSEPLENVEAEHLLDLANLRLRKSSPARK